MNWKSVFLYQKLCGKLIKRKIMLINLLSKPTNLKKFKMMTFFRMMFNNLTIRKRKLRRMIKTLD